MKSLRKPKITDNEYQNALMRLEFIYNEKKTLENANHTKAYNAHIDLPGSFGELLINLVRKNKQIDEQIKLEKQQFLEKYNFSESAFTTFDELVELLEQKNSNLEHTESIQKKLDNLNADTKKVIDTIDSLIQRKIAHINLYTYITNLEKEEVEMKKVISTYEKQNKQSSIFPFRR